MTDTKLKRKKYQQRNSRGFNKTLVEEFNNQARANSKLSISFQRLMLPTKPPQVAKNQASLL
jgi:hypothetical protein